jgi:hypothetical protein
MNDLQDLMKRPYSLIQSDKTLEIAELGIKVKTDQGMEQALTDLSIKKQEYFENMLSHNSANLIPAPLVWKKSFFLTDNFALKNWIIKCSIASIFFIASVMICLSFFKKSLNRSIEKLDEVINPIAQDESKKVTMLKKNLEKYRPYIREIVKVMEEEKNNK